MKTHRVLLSLISFLILSCQITPGTDSSSQTLAHNEALRDPDTLNIDGFSIQEPKTVENLSIFMITGKEAIEGKEYTTLSKAMLSKEVIVRETGSVNELSIDNNSDDYIFIHSGDIVKGGKQDRTISYDVIVPPKTKSVPLASFCVEQGRWQQRSDEKATAFGSNSKMLSSRDLKLAAKREKNQQKVWSKVSEQKDKLNSTLSQKNGYAVNIADNESDSSLQLALESEELQKVKEVFYNELKTLIDTPNVLGYAYAINGEVYGVEIYNSQELFKDLWEKSLESIIVEAISKQEEQKEFTTSRVQVLNFMKSIQKDNITTEKKINRTTKFKTLENKEGYVVFTTEDTHQKKWIHKSYIKGAPSSAQKKSSSRYLNNQR